MCVTICGRFAPNEVGVEGKGIKSNALRQLNLVQISRKMVNMMLRLRYTDSRNDFSNTLWKMSLFTPEVNKIYKLPSTTIIEVCLSASLIHSIKAFKKDLLSLEAFPKSCSISNNILFQSFSPIQL